MKIRGRTLSTPTPRSDWNQADPKKADYIKNKPTELEVVRGYSAYQVAVANGFNGTEEEWLASLKGAAGPAGDNGKDGKDGKDGSNGADGHTPVKGVDYFTNDEKTEMVSAVVAETKTEIVKEVIKESTVTEVVNQTTEKVLEQVGEQIQFVISGKWSMTTPEHLSESVVPAMVQEVNFESEVSLYSDNTFLPSDTNAVVSTHKVICKAIEIFYMEAPGHKYTVIFYHVESTDAEFMELIQTADGKNQVIAYGFDKWNSDAAKNVDFGTVQNVNATFKEAFEAMAVRSETLAKVITVASVYELPEAEDGTIALIGGA